MLKKEFDFYLSHQQEFASKYLNKFLVIKGEELLGVYETQIQAYEETAKEHTVGTFLIQRCLPGSQAYSHTFHSRVLF